MDKVTFIEAIERDGSITEHAVIEHADGSFTSMLKSFYEAQQAALSTPNVQVKLDKWNYRVICSNHGTYTARADTRAVT